MAVRVSNVADPTLLFEFTCTEWALMSDATKDDWTVTENNCGIFSGFGSPYAASDLISTLNGVIGTDDPITLTLIDGVYTIGITPASSTSPGSMSINDYLKAQTYLEPVSLNTVSVAIPAGSVTSITVGTALLAKEYVVGDVFSVVDNTTGARVKLTVTADTTAGGTTISATGTAAAVIPIGGILVPIYSTRQFLTAGTGITIIGGVISSTITQYTDENAQDAVAGALTDSTTIDFSYNDIANTITASAITQMSITADTSGLKLSGDSASPGNTKLYGTNASGSKGWYDQPGGVSGYNKIRDNSNLETQREAMNFTNTATVSWGITDDTVDAETDITASVIDASITAAKIASDAVTTAKILDANVTTGKIANSNVTLAKIQNIATSRVLGRITAGAGVVEELTPANLYTLLSLLNGDVDRVPFYTAANAMSASGNFKYFSGTKEINVGGGASLDGRFVHRDAANIAGNNSAFIGTNNVDGVYSILLQNTRNLANAATKLQLFVGGTATSSLSADPFIEFVVQLAGNTWTIGVDNSDADKFKITPKSTAPGSVGNSGLIITSAAVAKVGINKDAPDYDLDVTNEIRTKKLMFTNNKPTAGAAGNGLGTGGAIGVISGSDNGFVLPFATGSAGLVAGGAICTITYFTAWPTFAVPVFCASNDITAEEISKFTFGAFDRIKFDLKLRAGQTLTASKEYQLNFNVGGQG